VEVRSEVHIEGCLRRQPAGSSASKSIFPPRNSFYSRSDRWKKKLADRPVPHSPAPTRYRSWYCPYAPECRDGLPSGEQARPSSGVISWRASRSRSTACARLAFLSNRRALSLVGPNQLARERKKQQVD
jgi:hypothetical protein